MKIFLICSKKFYDKIPVIHEQLIGMGYSITLPNCYDDPQIDTRYRDLGDEEYSRWKATMFDQSKNSLANSDAVLVLNFEKNGVKNYIGGATFLEMYDAYKAGKKIYLYNDVPEGILKDEIVGFRPILIGGNLGKIQ